MTQITPDTGQFSRHTTSAGSTLASARTTHAETIESHSFQFNRYSSGLLKTGQSMLRPAQPSAQPPSAPGSSGCTVITGSVHIRVSTDQPRQEKQTEDTEAHAMKELDAIFQHSRHIQAEIDHIFHPPTCGPKEINHIFQQAARDSKEISHCYKRSAQAKKEIDTMFQQSKRLAKWVRKQQKNRDINF